MGFSLGTTLQAVQDLASTLIRTTPTGLTFGETMFRPDQDRTRFSVVP
jgi:hypothetical protein